MTLITEIDTELHRSATLDDAHIGPIHGALGTIRHGDHGPRQGRDTPTLFDLVSCLGTTCPS